MNSFRIAKNPVKMPAKYFLLGEKNPFNVREAYRSIRTNLLSVLAIYGDTPKHICFTSAEMGDGKTLNCANIAVVFAEMGAKVLVVDADMRKPKIHRVFKIPATPGLSECLSGFSDVKKAIMQCKDVDGLYVLPSGKTPPNPTELILSQRFDTLLAALSADFDYIFIDAPPATIVTDATIISKKTLGAICVCKSGKTRTDDAKKVKDAVERGGGKLIGALLNGVDYSQLKRKKYGTNYNYYESSMDDVDA